MTRKKLHGRIAIVTGASRSIGIGAAICRALATEGADVFFTHWRPYDATMPWGAEPDYPETLLAELTAVGVRAANLEVDLSRPDAPARILDAVEAALGHPSILVNNATHSTMTPYTELDAAALDAHYAVNVRATCLLSVEFARRFRGGMSGTTRTAAAGETATTGEAVGTGRRGGPVGTDRRGGPVGRIISLTSGQSLGPMPEELAYVATKGAIEAFTLSLSAAVAPLGITVNAVNPGPTDTGYMSDELRSVLLPRFPFGRIGLPEDAARLVAFLSSDDAAWITGQVIHSEGGFRR